MHAVSEECGRLLSILVQACAQNKEFVNILEIGTGIGYSTLWMAKGLIDSKAKGKIYTVESNKKRAEIAKENIKKACVIEDFAQVKELVEVVHGNALELIPTFNLTFDFVFIDGKEGRIPCLSKVHEPFAEKKVAWLQLTMWYRIKQA